LLWRLLAGALLPIAGRPIAELLRGFVDHLKRSNPRRRPRQVERYRDVFLRGLGAGFG